MGASFVVRVPGQRIGRRRRRQKGCGFSVNAEGSVLLAPLPPDRIVAVWQSAVVIVQGGTSVMRTLVRLCAVLLLAAAPPGRAAAQDAQAFHEAVVAANKKLKAARFRVAQPLPALLAGNPHD